MSSSITSTSSSQATATAITTILPGASTPPSPPECLTYRNGSEASLGNGNTSGITVGPLNNITYPVILDCCGMGPIELYADGCLAYCSMAGRDFPTGAELQNGFQEIWDCYRVAFEGNQTVEDAFETVEGLGGPGDEFESGAVGACRGGFDLGKSPLLAASLLMSVAFGWAFAA